MCLNLRSFFNADFFLQGIYYHISLCMRVWKRERERERERERWNINEWICMYVGRYFSFHISNISSTVPGGDDHTEYERLVHWPAPYFTVLFFYLWFFCKSPNSIFPDLKNNEMNGYWDLSDPKWRDIERSHVQRRKSFGPNLNSTALVIKICLLQVCQPGSHLEKYLRWLR